MARYYVPFVNLNTFIYEPCGIEPNEYITDDFRPGNADAIFNKHSSSPIFIAQEEVTNGVNREFNSVIQTFQNSIGGYQFDYYTDPYFVSTPAGPIKYYPDAFYGIINNSFIKNNNFYTELSSTASFGLATNLKRNGPYGYPSWRQIRTHENPCTRNQRKKNVITVFNGDRTSYIQPNGPATNYKDTRKTEAFKEPVYSSREKPLVLSFAKGNSVYRATFEMGSKAKYFDNDRLNTLYAPYNTLGNIETDARFKEDFIDKTFKFIGDNNVPILSIEYAHNIFPQKSSLEYDKRVRTNFYHPWKDDRDKRLIGISLTYALYGKEILEESVYYNNNEDNISRLLSRWDLDTHKEFTTTTDATEELYDNLLSHADNNYPGILQNNSRYFKDLQTKSRNVDFFDFMTPLPRMSYNHTITPLTSTVNPYGMDIEGVNNGSLFNDMSVDHILGGDAQWDAGTNYGTNPFYDSYENFIDDIKKVGKDYSAIPEFRSSLFFNSLQNESQRTPKEFLEVFGGKILDTNNDTGIYINTKNSIGTTEIGPVSASSIDSNFFEVYSHSDFMRNFDIVQEISNTTNTPLFKMSLTCKAIKKFAPYEGFYPAERTTQIAETFRDSIMDNCYYTGSGAGSNVGDIRTTDKDRYVYFNNIMTPMFAPGIMFNSIKSGLAVDYPIHTSSLTLANGGVRLYNDDYYIQKPFDERVPFEALLEPSVYLSNKEIHCSEPHPSGNLSGSATWTGTGDTTEYQLMMHNFLAETANFFLQDQNFSFIASKRSDEMNITLESGSIYGFDVRLYKSQNIVSDKEDDFSTLVMTGSGVQETFTMYSRPSAFGPPSRITGSHPVNFVNGVTASYSDLGYNWSYTPSYYDGISSAIFLFNPTSSGEYSLQDIFNEGIFIEERIRGFEGNSGGNMDSSFANNSVGGILLHNFSDFGNISSLYDPSIDKDALISLGYNKYKDSCSNILSSLNINLGIIKDVDLLDDDTSDTVKVAVDISSDKKSQIIIQPKWETPMFNFQSYGDSDNVSLPLVASQSVPRGIWHQYGAIETDPKKGIFMQISDPRKNKALVGFADNVGARLMDLSKAIGLPTEPVKLGKTASKKVVREAIVAVPFYEYTPNGTAPEQQRKFFQIHRGVIQDALEGNGKQNVIDMVNKMQRFVMPPMFNFLEDQEIPPITMYMFDFKHTFDQEDLGAIWQNLPPKLMTEFQTEEKTISHTFEEDDLLSIAAMEDIGDPQEIMKRLRWMVFKVKQKAEQNYYDKIVGETQKLNKTSPYSHNWPYDYFSLVELAKIETKVDFAEPLPEVPENTEPNIIGSPPPVANIPNIGPVRVAPTLRPERIRREGRRSAMDRPISAPNTRTNKRSNSAPQRNTPAPSIPVQNPAPISSNPPKTKTNNKSKRGKKTGMNNIRGTKK